MRRINPTARDVANRLLTMALALMIISSVSVVFLGTPVPGVGTASADRAVVDDFNDGDVDEYSMPEGDSTSVLTTDTTNVFEGSHSMELQTKDTGATTTAISSSGLPNYPGSGDYFQSRTKIMDDNSNSYVMFGYQDANNRYQVDLNSADEQFKLYVRSGGTFTLLDSQDVTIPVQDWVRVEVEWNVSGNDYITASLYNERGDEIATVSAQDSTYASGSMGFGVSNSVDSVQSTVYHDYLTLGDVRGSTNLTGTAVNQGGQGVPDGTVVQAYGVDRQRINPDAGETRAEKAAEIRERISTFSADDIGWNPDKQLTGSGGAFQEANGKYVAVHSTESWALERWRDSPDLTNPKLVAPADEEFVLSVWNPEDQPLLQDGLEEDLPGSVDDDTDIVIQQLDYKGDAIQNYTVPTSQTYDTTIGSDHDFARVSLPSGFYRVRAEGSPVSYVITVGNPNTIMNAMVTNLQNKADSISAQAELLKNRVGNSTVAEMQTTTFTKNGQAGQFNLTVPTGVDVIYVQVYSPTAEKLADPQNATFTDMLSLANKKDYNQSFVMTRQPKRVEIPNSDVRIEVVEVGSLPYQKPGVWDNRSDYLDELIDETSLADSVASYLDTSKMEDSDLTEIKDQLGDLAENNEDLRNRYEELLEDSRGSDADPDLSTDGSREELLEEIRLLRQSIRDTGGGIAPEETDTSTSFSDGTVSATIPWDDDLDEGAASVTAHFPESGVSQPVPDEYVTVNKEVGAGDVVEISDYPVPNGTNTVTFGVAVNGEDGDGLGNTKVRATNPNFEGTLFQLESVSVNTLRPSDSERVTLTLHPGDQSLGLQSLNSTIESGNGQVVSTNVTGSNTVTFRTNGTGPYYVRLEMTDTGGNTWHEAVSVKAFDENVDQPPSVRARDGVTGLYAMVGDGLKSGSVSTEGGQVTATGVAPSDEVPSRVHFYTSEVSSQFERTEVTVMKGTSQNEPTSIQKHVTVYLHTGKISEDAIVYRNNDPLPSRGSNAYGAVTCPDSEPGCTIESYTDSGGQATFRVNNNPTLVESSLHWVRMNIPISSPIMMGLDSLVGGSTGAGA